MRAHTQTRARTSIEHALPTRVALDLGVGDVDVVLGKIARSLCVRSVSHIGSVVRARTHSHTLSQHAYARVHTAYRALGLLRRRRRLGQIDDGLVELEHLLVILRLCVCVCVCSLTHTRKRTLPSTALSLACADCSTERPSTELGDTRVCVHVRSFTH
jgi:hypothetical protein